MDATVAAGLVGAGGAVVGAGLTVLGSWLTTRANAKTVEKQLNAQGGQLALDRVERQHDREHEREMARQQAYRDRRFEAHRAALASLGKCRAELRDSSLKLRGGESAHLDVETHNDFRDAKAAVAFLASDATNDALQKVDDAMFQLERNMLIWEFEDDPQKRKELADDFKKNMDEFIRSIEDYQVQARREIETDR